MDWWSTANRAANNIQILNNTIYGNKGYGIQAWQPINGLAIKNNILVNNAGYGIGFSATGITNSTVVSNLIFGNTLGTTAYVSGATGTIVADPAFTAPASRDFSLQAASPAINRGLYLGGPYQLGLKKGSIWPFNVLPTVSRRLLLDIGSFVYTSGGLTSSTTLLASSANPSLLGASVTFTAGHRGTRPPAGHLQSRGHHTHWLRGKKLPPAPEIRRPTSARDLTSASTASSPATRAMPATALRAAECCSRSST